MKHEEEEEDLGSASGTLSTAVEVTLRITVLIKMSLHNYLTPLLSRPI